MIDWYDWHIIHERLQARLYSWTFGAPYRLVITTEIPTAGVSFTDKCVCVNPLSADELLKGLGLEGDTLAQANFQMALAHTAHEGEHILYSNPSALETGSEQRRLHMVINILEDARVESIGGKLSYVKKKLYAYANSIFANQSIEYHENGIDSSTYYLHQLLRWKQQVSLLPMTKEQTEVWDKIKPLAQQAYYAKDTGEVRELSVEILRITGMDAQDRAEDEYDKLVADAVEQALAKFAGQAMQKASGCVNSPRNNPFSREVAALDSLTDDIADDDADGDSEGDINEQLSKVVNASKEDLSKLISGLDKEEALIARIAGGNSDTIPDVVAKPYVHLMSRAVEVSACIKRELVTRSAYTEESASVSGRFKTRYYLRDNDLPFSCRTVTGESTPAIAISLVLDRSGSMQDIIEHVHVLSMGIYLACEDLKIPLEIRALEGNVSIKSFDEHGPQILAKIAGIEASTGTKMGPTLRAASRSLLSRNEEVKEFIVIHDGLPFDNDAVTKVRELLAARDVHMFGIYTNMSIGNENIGCRNQALTYLFGARNFVEASPVRCVDAWCTHVKNAQQMHTVCY